MKKELETKLEQKSYFLNKSECKLLFKNNQIFVFGTGVDAEHLQNELSKEVSIIAYIDNNRSGEGNYFYGKEIISLSQCLERRNSNEPIIVASYRFGLEICRQLEENGLLPGLDYYMWDEKNLFHMDENTKEYTKFLKDIFQSKKRFNTENKILIPFDNRHDLVISVYAYCANYFAEKYDATIYGYFRGGSDISNASEVMKDIYKAFNVDSVIDTTLNELQQKEVEDIVDSLWENLFTWEDWNNIKVYGIHFGTTIIRNFLRVDIPCFDLRDKKMYLFLKKAIKTIVFWYHYIFENNINVVILSDGVHWDGYIRDIAITKGIPTYALEHTMDKMRLNFSSRQIACSYFKDMWEELTPDEKEYGLKWAEEHIRKRIQGGTEEVFSIHKNMHTFAEKKKEYRILEDNNKIKVIIFPHIFEEDCYFCGEQIFDNNYFEWLCHLGELSEKTPQYDWYLKIHPHAQRRDFIIIDNLLKKYSKIKKIPSNVSPNQLKEEGADFALTVLGTIGHELPAIGIQVINAGNNPHMAFDFNWNPKTKEEYDNLILNLEKLDKKLNEEELYKFYSLHYLFYDWKYVDYGKIFFKNPVLAMDFDELKANGKMLGTWLYKEYMEEWTEERHYQILGQLEDAFKKLDEWKPEIFYRKSIVMK